MRGGAREGAGRPPVPTGNKRKIRSIRLHDDEYELVKEYVKGIRRVSNMDLKTILDNYDAGKADLLDVALILTEECGLSDPAQSKRALAIINRDCPVK